jgi:hypothetical protein
MRFASWHSPSARGRRQEESGEIDYGPLTGLIGSWKGDEGMDVAPEPDGKEESPYYETLECVTAGGTASGTGPVILEVRA